MFGMEEAKEGLLKYGNQTGYLTVKQMSERTGLSVSTLRYYDQEGLTPQVTRSRGGVRQYTKEDVCWLELIACLKHSGMALADIRRFMEMCGEGEEAADERKKVLAKQKERLEKQIACLKCSLELIEYKLAHYREIGVFGAKRPADPAVPGDGGQAELAATDKTNESAANPAMPGDGEKGQGQ